VKQPGHILVVAVVIGSQQRIVEIRVRKHRRCETPGLLDSPLHVLAVSFNLVRDPTRQTLQSLHDLVRATLRIVQEFLEQ
jgi:hypothetical protein